jgi:hypothetical protein
MFDKFSSKTRSKAVYRIKKHINMDSPSLKKKPQLLRAMAFIINRKYQLLYQKAST